MAHRIEIELISPADLHLEVLPPSTKKAFLKCANIPFFRRSKWYLAGGTALGLQVGHRKSVDLDFFTTETTLRVLSLERNMREYGEWVTSFSDKGTLYGKFLGAKISFIAYPFFRPSLEQLRCGTVSILKSHDIAAMKIIAISQRGRKRDFIDLYWYCLNREPLAEVIHRALAQYPGIEHNAPHFLKSLIYFNDAEADPMPQVFFDADWKNIKKFFEKETGKVARQLTYMS